MDGSGAVKREEISREPWYRDPPQESNKNILLLSWGFLVLYSDGSFDFDAGVRPSDQAIYTSEAYQNS